MLIDGERAQLGPPQQRALLALLLLNANEVVSRDRIVDELWDERPPATAAKLVQVYVSGLRKALGDGVLVTRAPGYAVEADPDAIDARRFERLIAAGKNEDALTLWRGPPLADFTFADFAQSEIARLEELRVGAVVGRIDADLAAGRTDLVPELERLVGEHPLQERLRGQLMLALYRAGRQAEALAAYQDARRALVDELGIEPSRALRDLEEAILRQDPALELRRAERGPSGFVGRESELAELDAALEDVLGGSGRLVLIAGEPGIGKSRLAEELSGRAAERGARVLVGRCWEAGGAPAFWPWVEALRPYVDAAEADTLRSQVGRRGDLAAILPELRERVTDLPEPPAQDSEGARFRLLESVAAFLTSAARTQPLVLVLDDLHAADMPSILLLRFLASRMGNAPLLVAGCYRDTEAPPELAEVGVEPDVRRLSLAGLVESETSRLLESAMGASPAPELAAQIQAETQGNPLFAGEIGRLLASERIEGERRARVRIPAGVRDAIDRRVRRQSERCRRLLTLASVLGREFDPEAIATVSGLDEADVLAALDEAAAARLVENVPEARGRLRFAHILVRDTLYEDLPAPRRLLLHREIGEALERLYAANLDPHVSELAHHYLEAGSVTADQAIEYSQRAGDRAASQHGYEEAARHYATALELIEERSRRDPDRQCELLLSLGDVRSRSGSADEARAALRRAADIAEAAGRPDQLARAALAYGGRFGWARASTDPALVPLLERALAAVPTDDVRTRVRLLARLAGASRDEPLRERRVQLGEEALALARQDGDPATLAFAIEGHFVATEGPDEVGGGVRVGAELRTLGERTGDRELVFAGHDHRIHNFWQLADRAGVEVELAALAALADELDQPAQHWHVGTGRTMLALMEGRFEDAEREIEETRVTGARAESWNAAVSHRLGLFVLRREQGRLDELEDTIRRSVHEYPALVRFRCALAHLYAELGREREARAALDDVMQHDFGREYRDAEWTFSVALLATPCAFLRDEAAAERLYEWMLPYERLYAQAPVESVFGSLARGLGVLAAMLGRVHDAERHFELAIETERRMSAPPWLAHAQHDYGAMSGREDLLDEAIAAYRRLGMESWAVRAEAARG